MCCEKLCVNKDNSIEAATLYQVQPLQLLHLSIYTPHRFSSTAIPPHLCSLNSKPEAPTNSWQDGCYGSRVKPHRGARLGKGGCMSFKFQLCSAGVRATHGIRLSLCSSAINLSLVGRQHLVCTEVGSGYTQNIRD